VKPAGVSAFGNNRKTHLFHRAWVVMPALSLATIVSIAASTELIARGLFPSSHSGYEQLFATADPSANQLVLPNTSYSEKSAESPYFVDYKFNSCGHRAGMECGPKPPGTYRIVMMGSSVAQGLYIPRELTFAAQLPRELSRITGRKIELYNAASGGKYRGGPTPALDFAKQFNEVMDEEPDLILWVITPNDIAHPAPGEPAPMTAASVHTTPLPAAQSSHLAKFWDSFWDRIANGTLGERLRFLWEQSKTSVMLRHILIEIESPDQYVKSYLKNEDDAAFLATKPDEKWQGSRLHFQAAAASYQERSNSAGLPFVAVLVPNRAQAAMISTGEWPQDYDPYKLDEDLRAFIVGHGGIYIDILADYRLVPNPERHYFPVDGHPDAEGHAMISKMLVKGLSSGAVPALRAASSPQNAAVRGR
jgi:hypothetical protein